MELKKKKAGDCAGALSAAYKPNLEIELTFAGNNDDGLLGTARGLEGGRQKSLKEVEQHSGIILRMSMAPKKSRDDDPNDKQNQNDVNPDDLRPCKELHC